MTTADTPDTSMRFLFDDSDIRGELLTLGPALAEITGAHDYSLSLRVLLGQFATAAVLISNNLKYRGKIVLQARSTGPISLIMVECTSDLEIRGIARGDIGASAAEPMTLIEGGQLAITIERDGGQRYQGIVSLEGEGLGGALDNYFLQSEQLNTRFWLYADPNQAGGMMLQQLPAQRQQSAESRQEQWQNATTLAETLTSEELFELAPAALLHRLYHEENLRLFPPKAVVFHCSCSRERCLNALTCLSAGELEEMLAEQGTIDMTCEMCGTPYTFVKADLPGLAEPPILH